MQAPLATSDYYHPLYERTVATLGVRPPHVTADAAFDAWHIYETCVAQGGMAAIPLNTRGHPAPQRLPAGTPLCPTGLPMSPFYTDGYRAQEFRCPLLHPRPTAPVCAHAPFVKGPGCVNDINSEAGGLLRVLLDRASAAYKDIDRPRPCAARINAPAKARGIERPTVRNGPSVRTLHTLPDSASNVHTLPRVRALTA